MKNKNGWPRFCNDKALAEGKIVFEDPRDAYLDSILSQIRTDAIRKVHPRVVLDPMFGVSLTGLQTILFTCRCDVDVINDRHDAFFGLHQKPSRYLLLCLVIILANAVGPVTDLLDGMSFRGLLQHFRCINLLCAVLFLLLAVVILVKGLVDRKEDAK